jgi:hypothetical protein
MSYMKNIALETRTCGEAEEDARLDRRDYGYTPIHRSAAWWREYNAEQKERARGNALGMWKRGLTSSGTRPTAGYFHDLERAGFVVIARPMDGEE